jgi:serine/threonine-protein kinase HipA
VGHALCILPADLEPKRLATNPSDAKARLSPAMLGAFCANLGIPEKPAAKVITDCVKAAYQRWPRHIASSGLTERQKKNLLAHFYAHPLVQSLHVRQKKLEKL